MTTKRLLRLFFWFLVSLATWSMPAHGQGFSVSSATSGDIKARTIHARINVASSDVNASGAVFIVADVPNTEYYFSRDAGGNWSTNLNSYFRGTLSNADIGIVDRPMDLSPLMDTKVYVGYAVCTPAQTIRQCYDSMINNGTVGLAHTISKNTTPATTAPVKGKITVQPYTQPSTDGSAAAIVTVSNAAGQEFTYWGLKDASGAPFALTETLLNIPATGGQVRTIYGVHGFPKKLILPDSGESITLRWGESNVEYRYYNANGQFVVGMDLAMDGSGNIISATPLNDNGGQFAGLFDDVTSLFGEKIDNGIVSLEDAAKTVRTVSRGMVKGGGAGAVVAIAAGAAVPAAFAAASVVVMGAGVAGLVVAGYIERDGRPSGISNLVTNLTNTVRGVAGATNDYLKQFSRGWASSPVTSETGDSQPEFEEKFPQYVPSASATVPRASSEIYAMLLKREQSKNPSTSTTTPRPAATPTSSSPSSNIITTPNLRACPTGQRRNARGDCEAIQCPYTNQELRNGECVTIQRCGSGGVCSGTPQSPVSSYPTGGSTYMPPSTSSLSPPSSYNPPKCEIKCSGLFCSEICRK